ncbi:MAG: type II toxin-antitoxin system RelE/ParE family toxin [Psychrosphaera sp.]|nr:type II toxin-antitoxin system RelE/ParE family toxin [Psychrosphaera sp.]
MAQINWTEPALNDLDEIAQYIAINNLVAAKNLVENVFNAVDRLADHPESGRIPPEIDYLNYREVIVNPCRVFYKIKDYDIYILYVMRQERDLKTYILRQRQ